MLQQTAYSAPASETSEEGNWDERKIGRVMPM